MTVSSDGVVTATVDNTTQSVDLTITFASVASTTAFVTVTRNGVTVRGLDTVVAPGAVISGIDHEAPQNTTLTYTAQGFSAAGALLATSTTAVVNIGIAADWLKSLTFPALSVPLTVKTFPDWQYDLGQAVNYTIGRPGAVTVSDVQRYPTGTLTVLTLTNAQQLALQALFASPGPYLFQSFTAANEPDVYVTAALRPVTRPIRIAQEGWREYAIPVTVVDRPSTTGARVTIPGHSYSSSTTRWPLYSSRTGTYLSRSTT